MNVEVELVVDPKDIADIQFDLSKEDKITMIDCCRTSNAVWVGEIDGELACVWGVSLPTIMSNRAYLWLWTTDLIKEHPFVFIRRAQIVVAELLEEYEVICGHCVLGARNSMRWLKWMGARFGEPEGKLIPFQIRKKSWTQ